MDFPNQYDFPLYSVISTGSPETMVGFAQLVGNLPIPSASVWPSANLAIFVEFNISQPFLAKLMGCVNGGTVSGNVDMGIYDYSKTRLVSKGTTAQSGASAIQTFDITDTLLNPGTYYMAMAVDNVTGQFNATTGGDASLWRVCGVQQAASSFVLPAGPVTFANPGQAYMPTIAIMGTTVV